MNLKKLFAPGGVTLMLAALPAAASATKVTVRVEGLNHRLLAPRHINVHNGWITRYGAPEGQCPASSAQGALDVGTRHRWRGTWSTQFGPEYEITSILGETHRFTSKYFWEIFTNNVAASAGGCQLKLHEGEQLLFAAVPQTGKPETPIAVKAPSHIAAGQPFTVKVVSYSATGRATPLSNATVRLGQISAEPVAHSRTSAKTNASGTARLVETRPGLAEITASKRGFIRAAPVTRDVS
jgi:hypothetical protein